MPKVNYLLQLHSHYYRRRVHNTVSSDVILTHIPQTNEANRAAAAAAAASARPRDMQRSSTQRDNAAS